MDAKKLILFIIIQGMINAAVFATEEDSTSSRSAFFKTRENKRLEGHVVKRLESPSLMSCSHSCLRNAWCTSTNFKTPSEKNGKGTCELNKHGVIDANTEFHDQQGVTFSVLLKSPCESNPCENDGNCIPYFVLNSYHCECKAGYAGTYCEACKFDFEDEISGWVRTGTAFNNQPTYGDNPTARGYEVPANQQGDWWIGSYEDRPSKEIQAGQIQGDAPQGTLTSPIFNIKGKTISFLIGGGCDMNTTRAELIVGNQIARQAGGKCTEIMARETWDVQEFIGQRAYVKVVDVSSGDWGHINFDDLKGDISCEQD